MELRMLKGYHCAWVLLVAYQLIAKVGSLRQVGKGRRAKDGEMLVSFTYLDTLKWRSRGMYSTRTRGCDAGPVVFEHSVAVCCKLDSDGDGTDGARAAFGTL
jgi:hypothetical protein